MEYNAYKPNELRINPEILFTQTKRSDVILCLKKLMMELNMNHQRAEPANTPMTMAKEER